MDKGFCKQLQKRSFKALGLIDPNSIQNLLEKNYQQTEEQQQQKNLPLWQYRKEDLHIWYQNETKRLCLDHWFKPSCCVTEKMMKLVTLWEVISHPWVLSLWMGMALGLSLLGHPNPYLQSCHAHSLPPQPNDQNLQPNASCISRYLLHINKTQPKYEFRLQNKTRQKPTKNQRKIRAKKP